VYNWNQCVRVAVVALVLGASFASAQDDVGLLAFRPLFVTLAGQERNVPQRFDLLGVGLDIPAGNGEDQRAAVRVLLDGLPPGAGTQTVLGTYLGVLQSAEAAPYALTGDQEAEFRRVQRLLLRQPGFWDHLLGREPAAGISARMLAYEVHAQHVAEAEEAVSKDPSPLNHQKLRAARDRWEVEGFKTQIEAALDRYRALTGADPALWIRSLRSTAESMEALIAASPSSAVRTFTDVDAWSTDSGWQRIVVNEASRTIDCEVKRVALHREWLDATLFRSRSWRWQPGAPMAYSPVSSGEAAGVETDRSAHMPLLPNSLLLARNCTASAGGVRLAIGTPQVIGAFSDVVPRSPNPDDMLWAPSPARPQRVEVPLGLLHGVSVGQGGVNNKRGQVGPAVYYHVRLTDRYSVVVAPALALRLRGVGALFGVGGRFVGGSPIRAIAGVRIGTSQQRVRAFFGLGLDFSLSGR